MLVVQGQTRGRILCLRGINQQSIFVEDNDYLKYIDTLREYKKEIAFELYAYCLMGNHLHLLIKEGNEEIGNIMRRIGASYVHREISLRQLSRLAGFTIHRIHKVKV